MLRPSPGAVKFPDRGIAPAIRGAAEGRKRRSRLCLAAGRVESRPVDRSGPSDLVRRHLAVGWWAIFGFGLLGLVLEGLHGFKVGAYLDATNDTRRLMWTLAHAHGTLLGLVHLGFVATLSAWPDLPARAQQQGSTSLTAATWVLPLGFFAAGIRFYAGDPGLGIALVPVGAALLLSAAWTVARGVRGGTSRQ